MRDLDRRLQVAGDLQDLIAHRVSAIEVQAAAALLPATAPPEARRATGSILALAHEAMDELARLGRLLARSGPAPLGPTPTLGGLGELVEDALARGVRLEVTGVEELGALPAGVALCGYRCLEVLVAGAEQAGAGRVEVAVRKTSTGLEASCTVATAPDERALAAWLRPCAGTLTRHTPTSFTLSLPYGS